MKTKEDYIARIKEAIVEYKEPVKLEVIRSVTKAIDDHNLDDNDFLSVAHILGTPEEYVSLFLEELYKTDEPHKSIESGDSRLRVSYWIVNILIVLSTLSVLIYAFENQVINLWTVAIMYTSMILISIIIYYLSGYLILVLADFGKIYYAIFRSLFLFILLNTITDDYFIGANELLRNRPFFNLFSGWEAGLFVLYLLPTSILAGMKFAVTRSKRGIELKNYGAQLYGDKLRNNVRDIRNVVVILGYSMFYIFPPMIIFFYLFITAFVILFLIENHDLFNDDPNNVRGRITEFVRILSIMTLVYYISRSIYMVMRPYAFF